MDADTGAFYFIEVNPRIQVEHTVTEVVTGLDIVKAQIRIAEGGQIGVAGARPASRRSTRSASTATRMQCRITTENPENNFIPDYGRITAYRGAFGFGIRVDGGTAYSGAVVTRYYDPMLEKITAWAPTPRGGDRAHGPGAARVPDPRRRDQPRLPRDPARAPEVPRQRLHDPVHRRDARAVPAGQAPRPRDQAPDLHRRRDRQRPSRRDGPRPRRAPTRGRPSRRGSRRTRRRPTAPRRCSTGSGRQGFAAVDARADAACWSPTRPCATRTSRCWRPACAPTTSSPAADAYARGLPQLLSLECWGGATFDVAMRFLTEDPWERLRAAARARAQRAAADAAARRQRRRLHQLPRQCRALLRPARRPRPAWTCSASSTA